MKKAVKTILNIYAVFSMVVVTILIIAALVVWINFGKITSFAVEKAVNNFNAELNGVISSYLAASVPGNAIQFESIKTIPSGGGLQATFSVDNSALADIDIQSYQNKSSAEIISDLGITINDIPPEAVSFLKMANQTLVFDIKDRNGNTIINRAVSTGEIEAFLAP